MNCCCELPVCSWRSQEINCRKHWSGLFQLTDWGCSQTTHWQLASGDWQKKKHLLAGWILVGLVTENSSAWGEHYKLNKEHQFKRLFFFFHKLKFGRTPFTATFRKSECDMNHPHPPWFTWGGICSQAHVIPLNCLGQWVSKRQDLLLAYTPLRCFWQFLSDLEFYCGHLLLLCVQNMDGTSLVCSLGDAKGPLETSAEPSAVFRGAGLCIWI